MAQYMKNFWTRKAIKNKQQDCIILSLEQSQD